MKVVLSADANDYVRSEAAYLRTHSSMAAVRFIDQVRTVQKNLSRFPDLGTEVARSQAFGMRQLIAGSYVFLYDVDEAEIQIIAIRHSRQMPIDADPDQDQDYTD